MGLNLSKLQEKYNASITGGDFNSIFFQLQEGRNVFRILPRCSKYFTSTGDNDFAYCYYVHYGVFDVPGYKAFTCLKTVGQSCPVCEYARSLMGVDKARGRALQARERYLFNVFDYNTNLIKVFESGPYIYQELLKHIIDPMWGDFTDPVTGRDVVIEKKPVRTGILMNPYSVMLSPQQSSIKELLPEDFIEQLDRLEARIPAVRESQFYLSVVQHLRNGTVPLPLERNSNSSVLVQETNQPQPQAQVQPQVQAHSQAQVQPQPQPQTQVQPQVQSQPQPQPQAQSQSTTVTTTTTGKPECFGLNYSIQSPKCLSCAYNQECRQEILRDL